MRGLVGFVRGDEGFGLFETGRGDEEGSVNVVVSVECWKREGRCGLDVVYLRHLVGASG